MMQMTKHHEEEISQKSQQFSAVESELHEEKSVSNKLRSQLRELNIQFKEDGSARQKEKHMLERELEIIKERLLEKKEESNGLRARFEAEVVNHKNEVESLRTEHAAQTMVIETRGADIVSDLEEAMTELDKELADSKVEHGQEISRLQHDIQATMNAMNSEKERVERSLADRERAMVEQQEKISSLAAYGKERKEEVKTVKTELARVKHTLEDAVAAARDEMQNGRVLHDQEMSDLQNIADNVRSELDVAKERLASEDNELNRAKSTLSERTNLLRDMVNQTTAYQSDYEREYARANSLEEAASSYKKQLAEVRVVAQRLEGEIHDKDTHYCDAIRNERQQRKTMESELESLRKSMEDVLRTSAEVEKENSSLKDKVSRQEKYIGRLQDREKQNRRTSTVSSASQGPRHRGATSRIVRPSSADARSPVRNAKERVAKHYGMGTDENDKPNIGSVGLARSHLPQSPDEFTSLLK